MDGTDRNLARLTATTMTIPLQPPFRPMEALPVDQIPSGGQWRYEPKWDGFRCLAFRDGEKIELQSKAERVR